MMGLMLKTINIPVHTGYKLLIDSLSNGFIIIRNMHILSIGCKYKFIFIFLVINMTQNHINSKSWLLYFSNT
jgi:hypothetical protein